MPRTDGADPIPPSDAVLSVRHLSTDFVDGPEETRVVDDISFDLHAGETLGLVGESGSGKSVTALSIARLLPSTGRSSGNVLFQGQELLGLTEREMEKLRGRDIGLVFQDPMTSLNPTLTIGFQIAETATTHLGMDRREARSHALDLLTKVGIPKPEERIDSYPHQFSGGMRQRVMIAIAIACSPKLLIADEPTTALDVTVQAQILELLGSLADELGIATILITHDLAVAARACDRVQVMYAGRLMESAPIDDLFADARMPYTSALLRCLPRLDDDLDTEFSPIPGAPPNLKDSITGCRFAPRCEFRQDKCSQEPLLTVRAPDHLARCWGTEPGGWIE